MEFQGELNLPPESPVGAAGALQQAERTTDSGVGRIQNGRIEEVDGFTSQLQLEPLAKVEKFGRTCVECVQPWTAHRGNTASTKRSRILRPKIGRVKPLIAP